MKQYQNTSGGTRVHRFLRSVGFSQITKRTQMRSIILDVVRNYDDKKTVNHREEGTFAEFTKYYGNDCGIKVCGQYDEENKFHADYYFPFFQGTGITSREPVVIEQHADKDSFAGACDDLRIGVTLIFYLQNAADYMLENRKTEVLTNTPSLTLSGLASEGKILLPIQKDKEAVIVEKETAKNRSNLLAAARNGDEEAMENLTMEDMDLYSMISQRIVKEDVFSIVDSYFMPYGMECDQYNVLGEIQDYSYFRNSMTGEELCQLTLESNDMQYDVCINSADLLGEPEIGRRFKGIVWLQGQLQY